MLPMYVAWYVFVDTNEHPRATMWELITKKTKT